MHEAVERVAVKCGKRRKGENVFERHRFQHQSILLLLVAKHIGEREAQSQLCRVVCSSPDAGEAQVLAIRRRLARVQSRCRYLRLVARPPNERVCIEEELHASRPS